MYEAFYGFKEKPFNLTPDPEFLYLSPKHERVRSHLVYGLETGQGFIVVTGEIGSGKTTLVRHLIGSLSPAVKVACVVNPRGTFRQLMRQILDEFGVAAVEQNLPRERLLAVFRDFVTRQAEAGGGTVIIFDEAQNLDPAALEEIRMLSNIETDKQKLVQIILVGQPELAQLLASPELAQLNQRIAVRAHLEALDLDETEHYIRHRLEVAAGGSAPARFTTDAVRTIHAYSGGIPRRINIACDAVLLAGFLDRKTTFNGRYVRDAITDISGSAELGADLGELELAGAPARSARGWLKGALIAAVAVAVGVGSWLAYKILFPS